MIMFSLLNKKIHKENNKLQIKLSNSALFSISSFKLIFFNGLIITYPRGLAEIQIAYL